MEKCMQIIFLNKSSTVEIEQRAKEMKNKKKVPLWKNKDW